MKRFSTLTMLFLASLVSAGWQRAPTSQTASSTDRRITLDVVVADKSGNLVPDLQRQDFTILDDKYPQPILSFHASDGSSKAEDLPMQVIFVVDAVNASFRGIAEARQSLEKLLRQSGSQLALPTSLVLMGDTDQFQTPTTRDGNSLADALNSNPSSLRVIGRSQGFYGGADRAKISLGMLEKIVSDESTQSGRKLLVWLSSGWPLLSGPAVSMSTKEQDRLFNTVVRLNTELEEARITLYSIDPAGMNDAGSPRTFFYETFLKGVTSASRVQDGNLGLQVLAAQSGGLVLNSSNDLVSSVANCLKDARTFYTLSFESPRADHVNEYHSLQVKVERPKLTARTRTGYYAQP